MARLASPEGWLYPVEEQRRRLLREIAILGSLGEAGCRSVPRVAYGSDTARSEEPWFVNPTPPAFGPRGRRVLLGPSGYHRGDPAHSPSEGSAT